MKKLLVLTLMVSLSLFGSTGLHATTIQQKPDPIVMAQKAIVWAFCGHVYKSCDLGRQALAVSYCESTWRVWARNGQYWGLFQMGKKERARWGYGIDPWSQATAAYKMYIDTRVEDLSDPWHRWDCKKVL